MGMPSFLLLIFIQVFEKAFYKFGVKVEVEIKTSG